MKVIKKILRITLKFLSWATATSNTREKKRGAGYGPEGTVKFSLGYHEFQESGAHPGEDAKLTLEIQ